MALPSSLALSGVATLTYYHSYAPCCEGESNYDPNADTTECDLYSACNYTGQFASWSGKKSLEFVQNASIIAFYEYDDQDFSRFYSAYSGRNITLVKDGTIIFDAVIADTCGDTDCNGCCNANSRDTGFLVDLEYFTMMRNFDHPDNASGVIEFHIEGLEDPAGSGGNNSLSGPEYYIMICGIIAGCLLICAVIVYYFYDRIVAFVNDDDPRRKSEKSWQSVFQKDTPSADDGAQGSDLTAEKHLELALKAVNQTPDPPKTKSTSLLNVLKSSHRESKPTQKPGAPPPPTPLLSNMFDHKDGNEEFSNENPNMTKKKFSISDL
mmetsp:Transcript_11543/g.18843  ORF Transcript_11543/g.18843 Transcript_11543/m.18843 type:complete len:323 (-) Transcript_11543:351-1319(-)